MYVPVDNARVCLRVSGRSGGVARYRSKQRSATDFVLKGWLLFGTAGGGPLDNMHMQIWGVR